MAVFVADVDAGDPAGDLFDAGVAAGAEFPGLHVCGGADGLCNFLLATGDGERLQVAQRILGCQGGHAAKGHEEGGYRFHDLILRRSRNRRPLS